jgi:hypothetical protein
MSSSSYDLFPSVWTGSDAALLERMLPFYHPDPERILDVTVNRGRFWRDSSRAAIGLDIDPSNRPELVANNNALPFLGEAFDVLVYDPPHIPDKGADRKHSFKPRYGLGEKSGVERGHTFAHQYAAFLQEGWRVLRSGGVLLCKISDYIHADSYRWAHVDLIRAAQRTGFTACDLIIKIRKTSIIDPKWKKARHARKIHCFWLVFRKARRCY